ncbi:helix-hairpin-helix motif-domain-containing protein [Pisolithus marmoratus]|nr:helix-hairpin-helix motif-domain-containing protein [Pisolithus marmoratus]
MKSHGFTNIASMPRGVQHLSPIAKYCIGLACADITAILFEDEDQHLILKEKLLIMLKRVLIDVTNKVSVDINCAVVDSYYQHLLPFICGLGPHKAHALVRKIASLGGNLVNCDQFIKSSLLTTKIFLNAAGFLCISQDVDVKPTKNHHAVVNRPDPLDDTHIHPEDYELVQKMVTDALELDEEDIHGEHPSRIMSLVMKDSDNEWKLNELNLDEFAMNMFEANKDRKWPFPALQPWEGIITPDYLSAQGNVRPKSIFKEGQTVQAIVMEVHLDLPADHFQVVLSTHSIDLNQGDGLF